MGTLAKIRRMHLREGLSIKEIQRRTGLARNTIRAWLRKGEMVEPKYPQREVKTNLDGFEEVLSYASGQVILIHAEAAARMVST